MVPFDLMINHLTLCRWKDISLTSTIISLGSPVVQNLQNAQITSDPHATTILFVI